MNQLSIRQAMMASAKSDIELFHAAVADGRIPKGYRFYPARPAGRSTAKWLRDLPPLPARPAFAAEGEAHLDRLYLGQDRVWREQRER